MTPAPRTTREAADDAVSNVGRALVAMKAQSYRDVLGRGPFWKHDTKPPRTIPVWQLKALLERLDSEGSDVNHRRESPVALVGHAINSANEYLKEMLQLIREVESVTDLKT